MRQREKQNINQLFIDLEENPQAYRDVSKAVQSLKAFMRNYVAAYPPSMAKPFFVRLFNPKKGFHGHHRNPAKLFALIEQLKPESSAGDVRKVLCAYVFERVPYETPHAADMNGEVFAAVYGLLKAHLNLANPQQLKAQHEMTSSAMRGGHSIDALQRQFHQIILRSAFPEQLTAHSRRQAYAAVAKELDGLYQSAGVERAVQMVKL